MTILSPTDWDEAVVIIGTAVAIKNLGQHYLALVPVDLLTIFDVAAGTANPFCINVQIGFSLRHYASHTILNKCAHRSVSCRSRCDEPRSSRVLAAFRIRSHDKGVPG